MSRPRSRQRGGADARRSPHLPGPAGDHLAAAREFYHDKLGLEILVEREGSIDFRSGTTRLNVNLSTTGTGDTQTQAGWQVTDLRAELAELRQRGVTIEEYDMPGLKTEDGVADIGFALIAWITDPGGNALAILERKP